MSGLGDVAREIRVAVRSLAGRAGFTAPALLTLALGIGATVAVFAVVDALLLEPLPYPESERIVFLDHHAPGLDLPDLNNSTGTLLMYREHARSFSAVSAAEPDERNLAGGDRPARIDVVTGYPALFDVVGVRPDRGRAFGPADAREGASPVAVLTHRGWVTHFGRDRGIVGTTIRLDGTVTEVVGIMPEDFVFPDPETVALLPRTIPETGNWGTFGTRGIARIAPGVTLEEARREVATLQSRIPEISGNLGEEFLERAEWGASLTPLRDEMVEDVEAALWVVLGTVGFLLLIACANVANLFLVRAEERRREVAIRSALGAGRTHLAAHFLSESLVLAVAGAAVGLGFASAGLDLFVAREATALPRIHEVAIDGRIVLFTAGLAVAAGVVLGALPWLRHLVRGAERIVEDRRGATEGRERQRTRKALIAAQVALALVLLAGSGLMLRSYRNLRSVEPGVRTRGTVALGVSFGRGIGRAEASRAIHEIREEVAALPGVAAAGATNALPLDPRGINGSSFDVEGSPRPEDELPVVTYYSVVTTGFFEAVGIPLLRGRAPERADAGKGRPVVWVSREFADRFLDEDPLGERVRFGEDTTWLRVAGVVGNVRTFGIGEERRPVAYFPVSSTVTGIGTELLHLAVRSSRGSAGALVPSIREAIRRVRPDLPVTSARTMEEVLEASMAETSVTTALLGITALMALLLGAVGIYGVSAYVVSRRTREIGVRIALGARPDDVRSLVLRQGLGFTAAGIVAGLAAAAALGRLMQSVLFEVSPADPATLAAVTVLLAGVSAVSLYLPARRATRVSPAEALKTE